MSDVETTAREMGWRPKEEFRGDESKWVDAQTFVSRGENFLPILRADNGRLKTELTETRTQLAEQAKALAAAQEAIAELKQFGVEQTKRQVEQARRDLTEQLKQAREAGDVEGEVRIQEGLADLREAKSATSAPAPAAAPAAAPVASPAPPPAADPATAAWLAENDWFEKRPSLRGLAMGFAEEIKADKALAGLTGAPFYKELSKRMEPYLEPKGEPEPSKVGSGRPTGGGGAGGGVPKVRTYDDLPADAKAACDSQARKLVGEGRAFKTQAEQRAHYVSIFFAGEA